MSKQQGFTIIELMIATVVFSTIMLIASATVVRFTASFQRGVTQTTTQNTTRAIIDDVSEILQTASAGKVLPLNAQGGSRGYCVQGVRYSYISFERALVREEGLSDNCGGAARNIASDGVGTGSQLIGENMRIVQFDVTPDPTKPDSLFRVVVKVAHGEPDMFINPTDPNTIQCRNGVGSQFCAVSSLSTTVKRRL